MKIDARAIIPIFITYLFMASPAIATPKECDESMPASLIKSISAQFPNYRVPRLADLEQENIDIDVRSGGDGCYVIAGGDFNGDHQKDFAALLTSANNTSGRLIVALWKEGSWQFNELKTHCDTVDVCYVKTIESGVYERTQSIDSPVTEKDEREKIVSRNDSILTGQLEATGVVYVYSNKGWHYVWVSN